MTQANGIGAGVLAGTSPVQAERTERTKSADVTSTATQTTAATASLSSAALLASALTTDDVRSEKVAALRAAVNDGSYQVPAGDLADKLLKNMLG